MPLPWAAWSLIDHTWLCFPEYLCFEWIIFISRSKCYSLFCGGKTNVCFKRVKRQTSVTEVNLCSRQSRFLLRATALCSSESFICYSSSSGVLSQPFHVCSFTAAASRVSRTETQNVIIWSHTLQKIHQYRKSVFIMRQKDDGNRRAGESKLLTNSLPLLVRVESLTS